MLVCPKCGYDNELGRIFCHSCGTKLDLNQIKATGQGGPRLKRKRQGNAWRLVRSLIELVVLCAVLWAIYLACQVLPAPTAKPTSAELLAMNDRRFDLERLVTRNRPGKLEINEKEVNTYLANLVMEPPPKAWLSFSTDVVRMELQEGSVKVMLWGELRFGDDIKKKLSVSYVCVPELQDGMLDARPVAGRFGYLPVHPWILQNTTAVQRYMNAIFGKLERERAALQKLNSLAIHRGRATLVYEPRTAPGAAQR